MRAYARHLCKDKGCTVYIPWYLYYMESQNMLRMHEGNTSLRRRKKKQICDCSRSNRMPYTDQITEIAPYACAPIYELPYNVSTMYSMICKWYCICLMFGMTTNSSYRMVIL